MTSANAWTACRDGHHAPLAVTPRAGVASVAHVALNEDVMLLTVSRSSPLGASATQRAARRAARSGDYRAERERLAEFHAVAKLVIHRRTVLGITQRELARRIGTQEAAISRLESGRHATNVRTLRKVFAALDGHLVIGYQARSRGGTAAAQRELVAV